MSVCRMKIFWVVADLAKSLILLIFKMISNLSAAWVWCHYVPRAVWNNNTALSGLRATWVETAIKIQLNITIFFFNYQSPASINCEYLNSQVRFQCTTKLNNIPETCLNKLRRTSAIYKKIILISCTHYH